MMPVELLMILPTSAGLPLTMELNTILHYHMNTNMNVETPSLFDLPKLAFQEKDLKMKASLNLRLDEFISRLILKYHKEFKKRPIPLYKYF